AAEARSPAFDEVIDERVAACAVTHAASGTLGGDSDSTPYDDGHASIGSMMNFVLQIFASSRKLAYVSPVTSCRKRWRISSGLGGASGGSPGARPDTMSSTSRRVFPCAAAIQSGAVSGTTTRVSSRTTE